MMKLDQAQTPLMTMLAECAQRDYAPFHTPGHKRGKGISSQFAALLGDRAFQADLPELPELDNLFAPEGVIQAAQELAAAAFGADRTWFLTNGSTSGVMAAILATCQPGDTIILPRNVHQSAISGLILAGAFPVFVYPEYDAELDIAHCVPPAAIAAAIQAHPDARAVMIVSPTYFGACGQVGEIAQLVHQHGLPLLVDEAHGAHFAFHPDLPAAALSQGADLVVQSTHKTLSALTQSAMVHVRGGRIDGDRLSKSLALVQSTSPSYLLLASLDAARQQMATEGIRLLEHTLQLAEAARSQIACMPGLSVLGHEVGTPGFADLDRTRLTVTVSGLGLDGFAADEILNGQLGVTAELPSLRHLTFIISMGNTGEDIRRLVDGFGELGRRYFTAEARRRGGAESGAKLLSLNFPCSMLCSPRDAFFAEQEIVSIDQAVHRVSAELVCPYPPGIPVLLPGEEITAEAIAYLQHILTAGGTISGCADQNLQTFKVLK